MKFRLHSPEAERDVLVALQPSLRDDAGYYRLGSVEVSPKSEDSARGCG